MLPMCSVPFHEDPHVNAELPVTCLWLVNPVSASILDAPRCPLSAHFLKSAPVPGNNRRSPCPAREAGALPAQLVPQLMLNFRSPVDILTVEVLAVGFQNFVHDEPPREESHFPRVAQKLDVHEEHIGRELRCQGWAEAFSYHIVGGSFQL